MVVNMEVPCCNHLLRLAEKNKGWRFTQDTHKIGSRFHQERSVERKPA
jgi:hypothetical protein